MKKIIIIDKKYTIREIYQYCYEDYQISLSKVIIQMIKKSQNKCLTLAGW